MGEKELWGDDLIKAIENCKEFYRGTCGITCPHKIKGSCRQYLMGQILKYIKQLNRINANQTEEIERLTEEVSTYILKAWFYSNKCKEYGIECFYDADLESQFKPAKEGKTITFPKFKGEVE